MGPASAQATYFIGSGVLVVIIATVKVHLTFSLLIRFLFFHNQLRISLIVYSYLFFYIFISFVNFCLQSVESQVIAIILSLLIRFFTAGSFYCTYMLTPTV